MISESRSPRALAPLWQAQPYNPRRHSYVYLGPFVEDEHTVFLKTIIPSRKATKEYLGEETDDEA